ncbi:hypothetical protein ID866_11449 [Astraeus odoratus]|nr:hypothetical protein ID866_11449 [Astraeus odoratus]
MSSPCRTLSPHECCLTKTKAPKECTEEEWKLVSEGKLNPVSSDDEKMVEMWDEAEKRAQEEAECLAHEEATRKVQEEAERKAEEECKVQEEAARVREEAKEAAEREEAAKRAAEAAEERADAERRAVKERLWEVWEDDSGGSQHLGTQGFWGPRSLYSVLQQEHPLCPWHGQGKNTACKACCHAKVSCSWTKKMVGESRKRKWAWRSEEAEEVEVINVDEDEDKEWPHFAVLQHLTEEHQDTLRALTTTLDTLSTDFLKFWQDSWNLGVATLRAIETIADELWRANDLKEEEMGRSKGKGKERAQEEFRRARMEDDDRDMEMGGAGPSSLA